MTRTQILVSAVVGTYAYLGHIYLARHTDVLDGAQASILNFAVQHLGLKVGAGLALAVVALPNALFALGPPALLAGGLLALLYGSNAREPARFAVLILTLWHTLPWLFKSFLPPPTSAVGSFGRYLIEVAVAGILLVVAARLVMQLPVTSRVIALQSPSKAMRLISIVLLGLTSMILAPLVLLIPLTQILIMWGWPFTPMIAVLMLTSAISIAYGSGIGLTAGALSRPQPYAGLVLLAIGAGAGLVITSSLAGKPWDALLSFEARGTTGLVVSVAIGYVCALRGGRNSAR